MRPLRLLPALLALLVAPSSAPAQSPPPPAPPSAPAPPAGQAPDKAPADAPAATRPAAPTQPPQPRRRGRRRKGKDPEIKLTGAVATFPGFRMLPGGGSRVFVQVNRKVDINESKAEGRLVYRMKGVQTIATNRYPLITAFFATPVGKVQLVPQGADLDMVIELRQPSDTTHRVMETERGIVLQVDFPAVAPGQVAPAAAAPRTRGDMGRPATKRRPAPPADDGPTGY